MSPTINIFNNYAKGSIGEIKDTLVGNKKGIVLKEESISLLKFSDDIASLSQQ